MKTARTINNQGFGTMVNPAIRRIQRDKTGFYSDGEVATYAGVAKKTGFFLLMTMVGVILYFALHQLFMTMSGVNIITGTASEAFAFETTAVEVFILLGALILTIACSLICIFAHKMIPVFGTIYVVAEGYLLAYITNSLSANYRGIGFLALILTVSLVAILVILYAKGIVKVTNRFRTISTTLFLTIILGSILLLICSLIPGLRVLAAMVMMITSNPIVSIISSVVFILIASMFLISDFDAVRCMVEQGMDKRYEWACAYGIAYTVLYLYLKILNLLVKIFGKNK